MNGFVTFLVSTGTITLLSIAIIWHENRRKKAKLLDKEKKLREAILSSSAVSWRKVGKVKEMFFYPLKSGKGKPVKQCHFGEYGISVTQDGLFSLKDRMFMVYEEKTGKFITGRQHPKLLLVNISPVDENRIKLEVADMPSLVIELPKITDRNFKFAKCTMWWGEAVKCLDCGTEASAWLTKFLIGSDTGMRLSVFLPENHRIVTTGVWEKHSKVYNTLRNEDTGLFSDLASYMVVSESSVNDLNERLQKPITPLQLRPNIVVEGCKPYDEDQWEWIKVGDSVIIRNFKLCTRCSMVRIDPDTGIPDSQSEPLKTLRTYRKLKNAEMDALESHAPAIGIYCGLYRTGDVQLGDDIYVYQSQ